MRYPILALLCCLLAVLPSKAQVSNHKGVALLVVECEATGGPCNKHHLIRYRFRDGEQVSKDVVVTTSVHRVRFDLGQNHIYLNRYVITEWGDVIDVRTKKVLHDGIGEYVGAEGSRIVQSVERIDIKGIFYYDIESNRYSRLRSPGKWALPGLLSPDQTKSVSVSDWGSNEVWLHTLKRKQKRIASGFRASVSESCCSFPKIPVLWLDNDRILTQKSNGEIVTLRVTGEVEALLKIPVGEPPDILPQLYRNAEGQIVYEHGNEAYVLDVENKKYTPYEWASLGNGFERERGFDKTYGHIFRFQGGEIGRWWACCAKSTNGFVAMEYGDVGSNLGYPKGVKVWNSTNKKWVTIDARWLSTIIGWIVE